MATEQRHITRIEDTWAGFLADGDHGQSAILTDTSSDLPYEEWVYKSDDAVRTYVLAMQKYWEGAAWTYCVAHFQNVYAHGDMLVGEYIYHMGDTDTYWRFETNKITGSAAGASALVIDFSGGTTYIEQNADQIRWTDGAQHYYWTTGSAGVVLQGQSTDTDIALHLRCKTEDRGDLVMYRAFGYVSGNDTEYLGMGWNANESMYMVGCGVTSGGTSQDVLLTSDIDTPTYQIMLKASGGNIGFWEQTPVTAIEMTHASPYFTFHNNTDENADGGRESEIRFRGQKADTTEHMLGKIAAAHGGTGDDYSGYMSIYVNDDGGAETIVEYLRCGYYGGDRVVAAVQDMMLVTGNLYFGAGPYGAISCTGADFAFTNDGTGEFTFDDTVNLSSNTLACGSVEFSTSASYITESGGNFVFSNATAGSFTFDDDVAVTAAYVSLTSDDSPYYRLLQTDASFPAQTWDILGNDSGVFFRDVTDSNKLPFKVSPGTATDMCVIDSTGIRTIESIYLQEQASANADTAAYGQIWVKDDDPNRPRFTDGDGTDFWLPVSDGTTGGSGSAGSGNQYVEMEINGTTYKMLHDGPV